MKRYALLRLEFDSNKVIFDTHANSEEDAIKTFNRCVTGVQLDEHGYAKLGNVSFCVAEYYEPFHTV